MDTIHQQAAGLRRLFALSREAVIGVREGRVLFANAAAARLFGGVIEKKPLPSVLSEAADFPGEDSYVTSVFIGETRCSVSAARYGEILVLTLLPEREPASGLSAGVLSRLRSSAFSLRVALDALARRHKDDETARRAYHSYYSLLHGIDQLSDVGALSRNDLLFRKGPLDLAALVRDLTGSAAALLGGRGPELACSVPEQPCLVSGDRERLEQMLLILLSNALLHTPAGGRVTLGLRQSGSRLILSVDDDGPGMDEAAMASAFSLREDLSPADAAGGAGMGLYIAQGIAHLHGGAIVLFSRPGEGTSLRVTLPADARLRLRDAAPETPAGPELLLRELSGVLPLEAYGIKFRD